MLKYVEEIGLASITGRVKHLVQYCLKLCRKHGLPVISDVPEKHLSGIINIGAPGVTKAKLKEAGIIARANGKVVTIGLHYYNDENDVDHLIDFLQTYTSSNR